MTGLRTGLLRTVTLALVLGATGCLDARDVDPAARREESELNRLQEIVNARPDMEVVQAEMRELQSRVQQAITLVAPAVVLPGPAEGQWEACVDPFTHSLGQRFRSGEFLSSGGGFTDAQWQQLVDELVLVFDAAGFAYDSAKYAPPAPDHRNASQSRDDGVSIQLVGSGAGPRRALPVSVRRAGSAADAQYLASCGLRSVPGATTPSMRSSNQHVAIFPSAPVGLRSNHSCPGLRGGWCAELL